VAEIDQKVRLEAEVLVPDRELGNFLQSLQGEGAVVSFTGVARPTSREGSPVTSLYLEHYPGMTENSLASITAEAADRFPGTRLNVVHRCGHVDAGQAVVFVAAASEHRRKAFEAAEYLMDRLKTEAAFWKREDRIDGPTWIEPTEQDRADRSRWDDTCQE
jgi:molybdopterin synthase catalytic subunit